MCSEGEGGVVRTGGSRKRQAVGEGTDHEMAREAWGSEMKKKLSRQGAVLGVSLVALFAARPAQGPDADRSAIRDHIHAIFEAYKRQDGRTIRATHTEDWTGFLGSSRGILRGIDDYMETAERSMEKTLLLDYEITDMEIQVHGDVALVYYVADIRVLDRPTGEERSVPLRSLDVYRRGPDGWNQAGSHIGVIPSVDGSSPWAEPSGRD